MDGRQRARQPPTARRGATETSRAGAPQSAEARARGLRRALRAARAFERFDHALALALARLDAVAPRSERLDADFRSFARSTAPSALLAAVASSPDLEARVVA